MTQAHELVRDEKMRKTITANAKQLVETEYSEELEQQGYSRLATEMCRTPRITLEATSYKLRTEMLNSRDQTGLETTISVSILVWMVLSQSRSLGHKRFGSVSRPGTRFTKYLTIILWLFYDNSKATIDSPWTSNWRNISRRTQGFSRGRFTWKIVRSTGTVFVNELAIFLGKSLARCKWLS